MADFMYILPQLKFFKKWNDWRNLENPSIVLPTQSDLDQGSEGSLGNAVEESAPVFKLEEGGYVKNKNRIFVGRIEQEGKKNN